MDKICKLKHEIEIVKQNVYTLKREIQDLQFDLKKIAARVGEIEYAKHNDKEKELKVEENKRKK